MLSALPPSCLGKGTSEEVSWGSLSVEERVKGWADLEGVCQCAGRKESTPNSPGRLKDGQVCTVWGYHTMPRTELEPPRRATSSCHIRGETLTSLSSCPPTSLQCLSLTTCREPGWVASWLGREEWRTDWCGGGRGVAVDRRRRWRITRKRMSASDNSEVILGLLCDCSPLLIHVNRICTIFGTLLSPLNTRFTFHFPQEVSHSWPSPFKTMPSSYK